MKSSTKWALGAAALLTAVGVGLAVARTATAAEPSPDAGKGLTETGVRHGIRYEGCSHFDLADFEALKAWGIDHKWSFVKWATRLDEVRANPEPAVVEALQMLFPECPWPPPETTTFGPQRVPWSTAMELAKAALVDLDLAGSDAAGSRSVELDIINALAFGLRERMKR